MSLKFDALQLDPAILRALQSAGYDSPTPVQAQAVPAALAGRDLMASAQTGSGKTAAFLLPALQKMIRRSDKPGKGPRVLVLTPTRELAMQVEKNAQLYAQNMKWLRSVTLVGGAGFGFQIKALSRPIDLIVATPGRLMDHMRAGRIDFERLEMLVLDEADRMLDMGFIDDIRTIMQMLPRERQTLLFSATFAPAIRKLAQDFMHAPETVEVAAQNTTSANVEQHVLAVDTVRKRDLLERLIVDLNMPQVIVFCKTKQSVDQVSRDLVRRGLAAQALHGDKSQQTRLETLAQFKEGSLRVLVATDVAARGLDIAELPFVINYELPAQPEDYVHRIGRTGRAGADGVAISMMDENEQKMYEAIKELTGNELPISRIEGFEPRWEQAQQAADRQPENRDSRERPATRPGDRRRDAVPANAGAKNSDPAASCGRIAGREQRRRRGRERPACALLQPNYGAK